MEESESDLKSAICNVCPHACKIGDQETGKCGVRANRGGKIALDSYGVLSSYGIDPIEKKPLYHYFPGKKILSAGSFGCNFQCQFCQNHSISQVQKNYDGIRMRPADIAEDASRSSGNIGVAYTYNEPIVWIEYVKDIASEVRARGMKNIMISNGYINRKPLEELTDVIDAWNIDLKSFRDEFYRIECGGSVAPVLRSLKMIAESGTHLEVTTLVIPGKNDSVTEIRDIAHWIAENCGRETPLHLSRYFPRYNSTIPPTEAEKILELKEIARKHLAYVYAGNIDLPGGGDTLCPSCNSLCTTRSGYKISHRRITEDGHCENCNYTIYRYI